MQWPSDRPGAPVFARFEMFHSRVLLLIGQHARILEWACMWIAGGLLGYFGWGWIDDLRSLVLVLVLPLLWSRASNRGAVLFLFFGYFLSCGRGMPAGASIFFGDEVSSVTGLALWALSGLLLASPYAFLWGERDGEKGARFLGALVISTFPPLAIIGWTNPLVVAGLLFPAWAWFGVGATLLLFYFLASGFAKGAAAVLIGVVIANVAQPGMSLRLPDGWEGVDTNFHRLTSDGNNDAGDLLAGMQRVNWIVAYAKNVPANSVRVLPEGFVGVLDGVAESNLEEAERDLQQRGARVLAGAQLLMPSGQSKNVVVVLGAFKGEGKRVAQGLPVPISMWKPWSGEGVIGNLWGRSETMSVKGERVVAAICYEQLLAYSMLKAMFEHPQILVAVSNMWWTGDASIVTIQHQTLGAFSRLFAVPVVSSTNK